MGVIGVCQRAAAVLLFLQLSSASSHNNRWSVDFLCKDSTDSHECARRVGICRSLHQVSGRRAQFMETLNECASQLSITLPESNTSSQSSPRGLPEELRQWLNNNLQEKRQLFECARARIPSKFLNDDGTVNREWIVSKINEMFHDLDEPVLKNELVMRAQQCDETSNCVYGDIWQLLPPAYPTKNMDRAPVILKRSK
ncbi:uncharacterized protein LOC143024176 isoform X2 [Oratosquilla oratoria]|uniref:uncharacterized protein LOC143024176 isoform X2 n=1 Tax=Oratosquilla oratoria TaxID=337810 RepID=UPI003F771D0F